MARRRPPAPVRRRVGNASRKAPREPPVQRAHLAATWLICLAPAVFLPGALNRFVFIKLAVTGAGVAFAFAASRRGQLTRGASLILAAGAGVLVVAATFGDQPVAQLIGRAPRYEGIVALPVYLGALAAGARLFGIGASTGLRRAALQATTVAAACVAFLAVLEAAGLRPLSTSVARPGSLLGNATEQGAYGVLVVGFCLPFAVYRDRWAVAGVIAGAVAAVTSASRGALLGLAVSLVVAGLLTGHRARRLTLSVTVAVLAGTFALPLTRSRLLLQSPLGKRTITGRGDEWASSLRLFAHHPVLGTGPSGFSTGFPHVETASYAATNGALTLDSPHALPLQALMAGGVPSLLLAFGLAVLVVRGGLTALKDAERRPWAIGALAALAGWVCCLSTHFSSPGSTPFACLLIGSFLARPVVSRASLVKDRAIAVAASASSFVCLLAAIAEIPLHSGITALNHHDVGAAQADFRWAHDLRPWDADLDANTAQALTQVALAGAPTAAMAAPFAARAESRFPHDASVLTTAAELAVLRGDDTDALKFLDRAHNAAPVDATVLVLRGQVLAKVQAQGPTRSER